MLIRTAVATIRAVSDEVVVQVLLRLQTLLAGVT
jgi:hypothetical protein